MKKRHEILFNQLDEYRGNLLDVVKDVTDEEAEIVPVHFNNNIRWNLGHVIWTNMIGSKQFLVRKITPENFSSWFGYGKNSRGLLRIRPEKSLS